MLPTEILPNMLQPFYYTGKSSYSLLGSVSQIYPKVKSKLNSHRERDKKKNSNPKEGILSMLLIRERSENAFLEDFMPDACPSNREYR